MSGAALLLWLALLGTGAGAAIPMVQAAEPEVASAMAPGSMPTTTDYMPCALCCIAPAPTTHGFSGVCKELNEPIWRLHAPPVRDSTWRLDTGGWRPRLPVRIVYCRWLD